MYLREDRTGETVRIGRFDASRPGGENQMRPCPEGFAALGTAAIERCARAPGEWAAIDEIGYLETGCAAYCAAIVGLMARRRLLAVVRKQETDFLRELCGREDVFLVDLDQPYGNLGCVIMASGLGKRFGGNKLMADFGGAPMLCRALDATDGIFARRVVVTRHPEVRALCEGRGIKTVCHQLPHRSDTVRLGVEAVGGVDGCLFCPGDQPMLRRDTVAALALCAANGRAFIWRAAFGGTAGSPVLFPKGMFPALRSLPEGKGGGFLAEKYPERVRTVPVRDRYELMDVDSPAELSVLAER